eukprot:TRINITY_DN4220_c0_g1_i1.p1 TRINITY_DN4220_c0_g1~~TRINITY_DN4220_c0_g1_i1.p1  ORF type:complete len:378 (+),score=48.38 TRINITY_DN4220_c0_g1_i1:364-1497(+)
MARSGNLDMLVWAHEEKGLALDPSIHSGAAQEGHLHIMKWAYEKGVLTFPPTKYFWSNSAPPSFMASKGGHLDCLMWIHEKGFELHPDCLVAAVSNERFEVANYIKEKMLLVPKMSVSNWSYSHQLKSVKSLEWLKENLPDVPNWKKISHVDTQKTELFQWCLRNEIDMSRWDQLVASSGNMEALMLGVEHGLEIDYRDSALLSSAFNGKNLEMMKWLWDHGMRVTEGLSPSELNRLSYSMGGMSIESYKWCKEKKFQTASHQVLSSCMTNENIELMSWVIKNEHAKWGRTHYLIDSKMLNEAIKHGFSLRPALFHRSCKWSGVEVLIALDKKGCKWDAKKSLKVAYKNDNWDSLMWILENCSEDERRELTLKYKVK